MKSQAQQKFREKTFSVSIPKVQFPSENIIKVGPKAISIDPDSRQARVLRYFWQDAGLHLPKRKLIDVIYPSPMTENTLSFRFEDALWQCSTQVLCRLRRTLSDKFAESMPEGTEWLPYSEELDGWILYKLPAYGSDGGWHS